MLSGFEPPLGVAEPYFTVLALDDMFSQEHIEQSKIRICSQGTTHREVPVGQGRSLKELLVVTGPFRCKSQSKIKYLLNALSFVVQQSRDCGKSIIYRLTPLPPTFSETSCIESLRARAGRIAASRLFWPGC